MRSAEVVDACMGAIEKNDFETAAKYVSDNMVMEGIGPSPIGKNEFLGVHRAFNTGLPDFSFNHKVIKERGNDVELTVQLSGNHTRDMQPPLPNLDVIKATNNFVKLPEEHVTITVKDDKITRIIVEQTPGGGVAGMLKQIGVNLHEMV